MTSPPVAIVIPVFNEGAMLAACLRGVLATVPDPSVKIILVDDGSTDGAVSGLPQHDRIQVIRHHSRRGVAAALNAGFAAAAPRDVVRLHADVVIETPGWLPKLAEAAYSPLKAGIAGPRLVYPDGRIESEGRTFVGGLGFQTSAYARRAFQGEAARGGLTEVDSVSGAMAYYRRDVIERVGGLDENYGPVWTEDDDFCFAARRLGYKVWVEPAIRAVHYTRANAPTLTVAVPGTGGILKSLLHVLKQTARRLQAERWESKWGWHPECPDVGEIRRLYGRTEVCWQIGDALKYVPTGDTPAVDCCLVTWNSLAHLQRTMESLAKSEYPADRLHVIVANNGSTDGTREYLDALRLKSPFRVTAIHLAANTGVGAALNLAIAAGQSELVARLDDDILLPAGWLKRLTADLAARPYAGCVGVKTVHDDDRRSIQWAMEKKFPDNFSHDDEPDGGQVAYLGRVIHVAGCCCLYRRDVFQRCGTVDVRYSPSQWDDVDHGLAMTASGYEVLCDGRVTVVHKKASNLDRSSAGIANVNGNLQKLLGKWGPDAFEILDTALTASREGRCLPENGDASSWLGRGPQPEVFPRAADALSPEKAKLLETLHQTLKAPVPSGSELERLAESYLECAQHRRVEEKLRVAIDTVLTVINFAPRHGPAYRALARLLGDSGQSAMARACARRGLHLAPGDTDLQRLAEMSAEETLRDEEQGRRRLFTHANFPPPGLRAGANTLRVLVVAPYRGRPDAAERTYTEELLGSLKAAGLEAHLRRTPQPDPRGFDVVHLFGSSLPHETLTQVTAMRVLSPDVPILYSPLFSDLRPAAWAGAALGSILTRGNPQQRERELAELSAGRYLVGGEPRPAKEGMPLTPLEPRSLQARIVARVNHLLAGSETEAALVREAFGDGLPLQILAMGVSKSTLDDASPAEFITRHGVKDFVLTVGLVEPTGNQLALMHALSGAQVPAVVVGGVADTPYFNYCRRYAPKGSLFLPALSAPLLASAYKAARLVAAPALLDPFGRSAVAGAFAGTSLALSDRLPDRKSFAQHAHFFDPEGQQSIREALGAAWASHDGTAATRQAFARALAETHDWPAVIANLTRLYLAMCSREAPASAAA